MNPEIISLIIKWGPLALMGIVFLICFLMGVIRGTYKVFRRLLYVVLYIGLIWLFIDKISGVILDLNVTINGVKGVRNFIVYSIESNETLDGFLAYSPELKGIIVESPQIIINPILFIVLVFVGLPLSFPIYWIYLIIFNLVARFIFKRRKYEIGENGEVLRNEKGKKIKVKRKKRRLLGGLLRGAQGVAVMGVILLPVNFVNRIYNRAKSVSDLEENGTICNGMLKDYKGICDYMDLYNETIFAQLGGEDSLDKIVSDKLFSASNGDFTIKLEDELSSFAVSAVLLNESGLMELFFSGEINLDTLDLNKINFDKVSLLVDHLFSSKLVSEVVETGVRYALNEVANDKLVELLKDDNIVSKLEYKNANEISKELKDVVSIMKFAVEKNIADSAISNRNNAINIVNGVSDSDVETLINKMLSLQIINKAMPSIIKAYGEDFGMNAPESMSDELNQEIASLFAQAVKFVKTMNLTSLESLTQGNIVDNLSNVLFENGALKSNSKESLATLLNSLNNSTLFKNVLSLQINKLLEGKDYKVDARVLKYVDTKEAWLNELAVLEKAFVIYDEFSTSEVINYANITDLLESISGTKVFISILPFAYDEILPKAGIEIDSEGLPVIDFDGENENASKIAFYSLWEDELVILKNIADAAGELELQSLTDINTELLKDSDKVESLSTVMEEVYASDLLKEPIVNFMKDIMNEFLAEYGVEFTSDELLSINTKAKWQNELSNIGNVLKIDLSADENINATNLETIFDSIGNMELFKKKKISILKVAIEKSNFLTQEEYNSISWPSESASQGEIDSFWDNETEVLVSVVDKKDKIQDLSNLTIETMDADEIGGLVNEVMKSQILKPIVVSKVSDLLVANDVKDDRDVGTDTTYLKQSISNVEDWKEELASIKNMTSSIDQAITTAYIAIEDQNRYERSGEEGSYTYTQNNLGAYLKVDGEYYLIVDEYRYNRSGEAPDYTYTQNNSGVYLKISTAKVEDIFATIEDSDLLKNSKATLLLKAVETINIAPIPSNVTVNSLSQDNYELYKKERDIIVEVSENKNAFDNLSTMELKQIDTEEIGGLLNTVTSSIIFKDYVVGKIETVFVNNGINDDNEDNGTLNDTISSISPTVNGEGGWKDELANIKEMLNIGEDNFDDKDGGSGKTNVEKMFDTIETSKLLKNSKSTLLLKAVKTINITDVPNDVTVELLTLNDYELYELERDIIIEVSKNKAAFDNLSTMELKQIDTEEIGGLLNTVTSSIIFKDYVVNQVKTVLTNNGINDDRGSESNLKANIASVRADTNGEGGWKDELANIKEMLNMTKDTFDDKDGSGKTNVEKMFDTLDDSVLLKDCRASILIKIVNTVAIDGVSIPTGVTSITLSDTVSDVEYAQYKAETAVLKAFAKDTQMIDGLGSGIGSLDEAGKTYVSNLLDAMKSSKIFANKYQSTVASVLNTIDSQISSSGYTGINVDRSGAANGYVNVDWAKEISALSTISSNISEVSSYNGSNITENKDAKIVKIGSMLDAIESSSFLGADNAQTIANAIIKAITGYDVPITKDGDSWTDAFANKI